MEQIDLSGLSFAELREKDRYYVDKSLLIRDILDTNDCGVYLFTRPVGFGKTVNLSMLDAFFNIGLKGNGWFDGLEISAYPEYQSYRNTFPVICLNLDNLSSSTFKSFIDSLSKAVGESYEHHRYLLDSPEPNVRVKRIFDSLDDGNMSGGCLKTAIVWLSLALKEEFGVKPVILIDGYDDVLRNCSEDETRRRILDYLGGFLHSTLKANRSRGLAVITGVIPVCMASVFSGLNNVSIHSIFSDMGDDRFGFTEYEVGTLLGDSGVPERMDEAREWYGGYRIGEATVFCPRSIMNYASDGFEPKRYGSDNGMAPISKLLRDSDGEYLEALTELLANRIVKVDMDSVIGIDGFDDGGHLFDLMVHIGLLMAIPLGNEEYELSIPNEEARLTISELVSTITRPTGSRPTLPRGPWNTSTSSDSDRGP